MSNLTIQEALKNLVERREQWDKLIREYGQTEVIPRNEQFTILEHNVLLHDAVVAIAEELLRLTKTKEITNE